MFGTCNYVPFNEFSFLEWRKCVAVTSYHTSNRKGRHSVWSRFISCLFWRLQDLIEKLSHLPFSVLKCSHVLLHVGVQTAYHRLSRNGSLNLPTATGAIHLSGPLTVKTSFHIFISSVAELVPMSSDFLHLHFQFFFTKQKYSLTEWRHYLRKMNVVCF